MITVISDFEKRVKEIDKYFSLLESIEVDDIKLFFPNKRTHKFRSPDLELTKILKANLFLLLYNLVESSIKQSINEIYDTITTKNLTYSEVIDEIKKILINEKHKNFKSIGTENIFIALNGLANEVIEIQFNSDKIISGNIDGRKIREFSEKYGFSDKVHKNANNGVKLHLVKTQRNNLAHGLISFAECGRNYTIGDLRDIKHEVILYLRKILRNIEFYLNDEKFRL